MPSRCNDCGEEKGFDDVITLYCDLGYGHPICEDCLEMKKIKFRKLKITKRNYKMITQEFKVGDIVVLKNNDRTMSAPIGSKAIVTKEEYLEEHEKFIAVKWINREKIHNQMDGGYYPSQFDKVMPTIQITENSTELERWLYLLNK